MLVRLLHKLENVILWGHSNSTDKIPAPHCGIVEPCVSIQGDVSSAMGKYLDDDVLRLLKKGADSGYFAFIHIKLRRLDAFQWDGQKLYCRILFYHLPLGVIKNGDMRRIKAKFFNHLRIYCGILPTDNSFGI